MTSTNAPAADYTSAPACALVATECACCGRPLLDADSVERGVGPVCAEKYGYATPDRAGDIDAALALLDGLEAEALEVAKRDSHGAANWLTHRIACGHVATPRLVAAVAALGYRKLAGQLAANAQGYAVRVTTADGGAVLVLEAPYSEALTAELRRVPGRRWVAAEKRNVFPATSRGALWAALRLALPAGTLVEGPKGLRAL